MKRNIAQVLTFSLLAASAGLISCVDSDKDYFDADKLKQIYEDTFPVKNVDPDGDWEMTRSVLASVSVNGDAGVDYTIRIFDANPLNSENDAKLLAEGIATNHKAFAVTIDCATELDRVFVARVDGQGHYLVQPVSIENGAAIAHFGDKNGETRAMARAGGASSVPNMEAPYTAAEIKAKKAEATEIEPGWDLGAGSNWGGAYSKNPVFSKSERWFKIPKGEFYGQFSVSGTSGGAKAIKVIVPKDSKWIIRNSIQFDAITEIIVEDDGKIEIDKNATLTLTSSSYLTVLHDGEIKGDGSISITNNSNGLSNYNAGEIECSVLKIEGGGSDRSFVNYGKLELDRYEASTNGTTLINHGKIKAGEINGNNNTNIKNGCYIETGKFQFGSLLMGSSSEAICKELSSIGNNNDIVMEAQSMLVCTGIASLYRNVTGPTRGKALLKISSIAKTSGLNESSSKVSNNIICEITDQSTGGKEPSRWSPFDWLVNKGLQNSATYCNPGKADFLLPEDDDCIKEGYEPDDDEDDVELQYAVYSYAFEDNYPYSGDYDFNDIVLNVTLPAAGDEVDELKYTIDLRAVGAIKQLGAGLRIRGIDCDNVESVSFGAGAAQRANSLSSGIFENVPYETTGGELVIPLFGDAHQVYGYMGSDRTMLNTGGNSIPLKEIYTLEVKIELDDDISVPSATDDLDFFIAYKTTGRKRTEIHLSKFNTATPNGALADGQVLDVIQAVNNTWALCVPDKFAYPTERTVITDAYPGFVDWGQNQDTNTFWYKTPVSDEAVMKY